MTQVDDFNLALPRMSGALRRTGSGDKATNLMLHEYDTMFVGHIDMGFAKIGHVDTDVGVVTIVAAITAPPGGRWDGNDLSSGDAAFYPGGGHHQAVDPAGMAAAFVVVEDEILLKAVDDLGRRTRVMSQGLIRRDHSSEFLRAYQESAFTDDVTGILTAVARIVSTPMTVPSAPTGRRLSSERIVRRANDYAASTGDWLPSSLSLCRASGVSERRMQSAFRDVYGLNPSSFFRMRALSEARSRLQSHDGSLPPVTTVAFDLGFRHLGRFASMFHREFGVYPSEISKR